MFNFASLSKFEAHLARVEPGGVDEPRVNVKILTTPVKSSKLTGQALQKWWGIKAKKKRFTKIAD